MTDQNQNPGRKWRDVEHDGDGNKYFANFRFTPYTTDIQFFKDPNIYETEVARSTDEDEPGRSPEAEVRPRGDRRPDERIKEEILDLFSSQRQFNASGIRVTVKEGIVTLSGKIDDPYGMQTAAKMVENILGVLEINNNLHI